MHYVWANWIGTLVPMTTEAPIDLYWQKLFKILFSETMRPIAYIFDM